MFRDLILCRLIDRFWNVPIAMVKGIAVISRQSWQVGYSRIINHSLLVGYLLDEYTRSHDRELLAVNGFAWCDNC